VTVALSGDGGDEGFGGYDLYRRLGTVQRLRELPAPGVESVALALAAAGRTRLVRPTIARGIRDVASDDDAAVVQSLYSWVREAEHRRLVHDAPGLEPPRRLFERQWSNGGGSDRLDVLSRHAVEINVRLVLPNDYLFKVDIGSMRHGLEVRVPLLDEDLMEFGLALPHALRANRRSAKLVLRGVAGRRLPRELAGLPKRGFTVPIDRWVDRGFRDRLRAQLLDRDSRLPEFFDPRVYRPWVLAFASGTRANGLTRDGLYQRVFMLLALDLALRPAPLGR
jgi:asparagine synthase (glutamine-hydrolysing)